ncbi:MAG: hypothetical protein BWY20_00517 [Spirochaetes bacterium ADurb.Bin215]|nr:MAG: hypothetical protein BWY20_00517 [Spirochaetes bacterium ADurb.Bin215]
MVYIPVARDKRLEPDRKGVYNGNTDTMQTAGDLVGALVKFTAGMKTGQNEFKGAYPFSLVNINGNSASIILDTYNIVLFKNDGNCVTMTRHCFVDTVIYNFVDQMMQTVRSG